MYAREKRRSGKTTTKSEEGAEIEAATNGNLGGLGLVGVGGGETLVGGEGVTEVGTGVGFGAGGLGGEVVEGLGPGGFEEEGVGVVTGEGEEVVDEVVGEGEEEVSGLGLGEVIGVGDGGGGVGAGVGEGGGEQLPIRKSENKPRRGRKRK